jgi:hypothetical protein
MLVAIHVDYLPIAAAESIAGINAVKSALQQEFKIRDLGEAP